MDVHNILNENITKLGALIIPFLREKTQICIRVQVLKQNINGDYLWLFCYFWICTFISKGRGEWGFQVLSFVKKHGTVN